MLLCRWWWHFVAAITESQAALWTSTQFVKVSEKEKEKEKETEMDVGEGDGRKKELIDNMKIYLPEDKEIDRKRNRQKVRIRGRKRKSINSIEPISDNSQNGDQLKMLDNKKEIATEEEEEEEEGKEEEWEEDEEEEEEEGKVEEWEEEEDEEEEKNDVDEVEEEVKLEVKNENKYEDESEESTNMIKDDHERKIHREQKDPEFSASVSFWWDEEFLNPLHLNRTDDHTYVLVSPHRKR